MLATPQHVAMVRDGGAWRAASARPPLPHREGIARGFEISSPKVPIFPRIGRNTWRKPDDRERCIVGWFDPKPESEKKAVAYYRHSAQDKQEYSVEIQQEHVRKFAADHGVEIVKEFADRGVTGVVVEDRDAFNEMMRDYIHGPKRAGLHYVLVYDVSRWGRFQKDDEAAHYSYECSSRGIGVVFSTMGFPKENDLFYNIYLNFERWRAAKYSQELSVKVWKGCSKIASYGYWAGGMPPYGMRRLLIDEQKKPVRVMERGEHKAIHNQRTILVPGSDSEVETIREIFKSFVNKHRQPEEIAAWLNDRQIPSPGKSTWTRSSVCAILTNEIYAGTMVWNKTSKKLHVKSTHNPPAEWVRTEGAFAPLVSQQLFSGAQQLAKAAEERWLLQHSDADMLSKLTALYKQYGVINSGLIFALQQHPLIDRDRTPQTHASIRIVLGTLKGLSERTDGQVETVNLYARWSI